MLVKGVFEIEIAGTKRGFKFGVLASDYFCREEGIKLNEMQERLENPTPRTAINCAYAAARSYAESKGGEFTHSRAEVADWLDEMGIEIFFEKLVECLQVYQDKTDKEELEKNAVAPK